MFIYTRKSVVIVTVPEPVRVRVRLGSLKPEVAVFEVCHQEVRGAALGGRVDSHAVKPNNVGMMDAAEYRGFFLHKCNRNPVRQQSGGR